MDKNVATVSVGVVLFLTSLILSPPFGILLAVISGGVFGYGAEQWDHERENKE